jgi:hypothetical protein
MGVGRARRRARGTVACRAQQDLGDSGPKHTSKRLKWFALNQRPLFESERELDLAEMGRPS